jgi:hypothetical protein
LHGAYSGTETQEKEKNQGNEKPPGVADISYAEGSEPIREHDGVERDEYFRFLFVEDAAGKKENGHTQKQPGPEAHAAKNIPDSAQCRH